MIQLIPEGKYNKGLLAKLFWFNLLLQLFQVCGTAHYAGVALFLWHWKWISFSEVFAAALLSCKRGGQFLPMRTVFPCLITGAWCSSAHWSTVPAPWHRYLHSCCLSSKSVQASPKFLQNWKKKTSSLAWPENEKKIYSLPFQQAALSLFNRQLCSYMGFPNCSFLEWGWSHLHQIAKKAPKANSPEAGKNCFDEKLSNNRGASKLQMAKVRWIIQGGRGNYPWG